MKRYKNSIRFTDSSRENVASATYTSMDVMVDGKDLVFITDNENESTLYRLGNKEILALLQFLKDKFEIRLPTTKGL